MEWTRQELVEEVLGEGDGEGEGWMRELERVRKGGMDGVGGRRNGGSDRSVYGR